MNVIDYINIGAGFNFLTQWNYDGATTVGEILFDRVFFTKESADTYIFKVGSFIEIWSPFNITIQNSEFSLNNYIKESFDAIMIRDTGDWTLTDDVVQNIIFTNNTLTLDNTTHDSSINLKISYSNSNKRFKNVIVTDNIFFNIIGAEKSLLEVEYYSKGTVVLTNNTFRNCSTVNDFLVVNAIDSIVMSQTTFDSCTAKLDGYISAGTAKNITINGLVLTNSSKNSDLKPTSLVKLSTENEGNLILNNLNFYQNSVKVSILEIDESIGALIFQNSQFNGEVVTSATPYINIFNIFKLQFSNLTFSNIKSDTSSAIKPLLVYIKNVEIDKEGDFIIESVKISNSTIGFLNIYGISGSDSSVKTVTIQDINVTNSLIYSQSDLMSIGPILTGAKLSFVMKKISFTNLNFASIVNMIHINVQSGVPFLIENWSFVNNIRGRIMLDPASTSTTVNRVHLNINNITVADNDFSTSTMFVLNEYWELHVSDCIMKRNSGYIYGTIASITGKNSTAAFTNCSFNNNNGANGGVFYVTTRSSIYLSNCLLF